MLSCIHDGIVKWKLFSALLGLCGGIHRSPVDSFHKGPVMRTFNVCDVSPNKLLNKHSSDRLSETPWRSYDFIVWHLYRIVRSRGNMLHLKTCDATNSSWSWWRHQMKTFSALLAICAGNSPVTVNSQQKGQWRGALMFSLICVRMK